MDKRISVKEATVRVGASSSVMIGGSSLSRKPLWLVRSLIRNQIKKLHLIVTIGGLDADVLIAAGALNTLTYAYVGLEWLGLAPWFRKARQDASLRFDEWSEGTLLAALTAARERLPFYPSRSGLESDLLAHQPGWQTIVAPYTGETLVAVPSLVPDVAVVHATIACTDGSAVIMGDLHSDPQIVQAARTVIVSAERVLPPGRFYALLRQHAIQADLLGIDVTGVVEAPHGASPGLCHGEYAADQAFIDRHLELARANQREQTRTLWGDEV